MVTKRHAYIGTVTLRFKGKIYGATTRQVNAKNKQDATKILKKNFHFKDKQGNSNKVTVTRLRLKSKKHRR